MIEVKKFVNELMSSNCYIVFDNSSKECIIVDPGSKDSINEINYIEKNQLQLKYIILTHEHSDHTWGVNSLLEKYPEAKVIASKKCKEELPKAGDMYFRLYYNDTNYHYEVSRVDIAIDGEKTTLKLNIGKTMFIETPGHSIGSMIISIGDYLFTGDTIMNYKMYVSKKSGSKDQLIRSKELIYSLFEKSNPVICPGHGEKFHLSCILNNDK